MPLIVVNVMCDLDANSGRLNNKDRREHGRTKLTEVRVLEKIRRDTSLISQEEC